MRIEKREINEELDEILEREYTKEENKHNINYNYNPFCFVAYEDDIILGLISGYSYYEEVYIDDLVVVSEFRGNNIGTRLVQTVEENFKGKGFNNINLCTNGFQAPKFYEKCGYKLEFVRKNVKNSNLDKYFYVKFFNW